MKHKWHILFQVTIALVYLVLAVFYNVSTPLWESPDEVGHFAYAAHIRQKRSLPRLTPGHLGEHHQPPLYYALSAIWLIPVDLSNPVGQFTSNPDFVHRGQGGHDPNASIHTPEEHAFPFQGWALGLHLIRLFSTLLGLGTVLLSHSIAQELFGKDHNASLLTMAIVAFNPQFLFISASANNDNLLVMSATGLTLLSIRALKQLRTHPLTAIDGIRLGAASAIVMLTKMLGIAVVGANLGILMLVNCRRYGHTTMLRWLVPALGVLLAATSPVWLRNWILYGDPLGWQAYSTAFAVNLRTTTMTQSEWRNFFRTQFYSFWGVFGWMNLYAPKWLYRFALALLAAAPIGWSFYALKRTGRASVDKLAWLMLVLIIAQELMMIAVIQRGSGTMWQGRYLFPTISAFGILLAGGLICWSASQTAQVVLATVVSVGMLASALAMPLTTITPAYAERATLAEFDIQEPLDIVFGHMLALRGYSIEENALSATVTLYWEARQQPDFDYSVFVHLLNDEGQLIGQDDQSPGADQNRPPTTWRPGDTIADTHRLSLLQAPDGNLVLRLGVYNWATGERLIIEPETPAADYVDLHITHPGNARWMLLAGSIGTCAIVTASLYARRRRNAVTHD